MTSSRSRRIPLFFTASLLAVGELACLDRTTEGPQDLTPDPSQCDIHPLLTQLSVDGNTQIPIEVTIKNRFGEGIPSQAVEVLTQRGSTDDIQSTDNIVGKTDDKGVANFSLFSTTTGIAVITVRMTVGDSIVECDPPKQISLSPGAISAEMSDLEADTFSFSETGGTVTFTLTARDAYGNLLTTGGDDVSFDTSSEVGEDTLTLISGPTDNGDGTYTATYSGTDVGTALTVSALVYGENSSQTLEIDVEP